VVGDDELGVLAQLVEALGAELGGLDLDVDGLRAGRGAGFENSYLIFDAAVEPAVILMAAAGGENRAAGMAVEDGGDDGDPLFRADQVIEADFEEGFVRFSFTLGAF
jgi:hypothetical protein